MTDKLSHDFKLKPLSTEGISAALDKAVRYRLLNEAREAESIARDVLEVDPANQNARITLILALTDQFGRQPGPKVNDVLSLIPGLEDEYRQLYYRGIVFERVAKARLSRHVPGAGHTAFDLLREAMECYEKAEAKSEAGDDSAILRWNTCARMIMQNDNIRESPTDDFRPLLE